MAILKHLSDGKEYQLIANTLVGRGRRCDVVIDNQMVSNHHADISWKGDTWELHDLGSLNGSFVDGRKLTQSAYEPLKKGAKLSFGDSDDVYELIDDAPPLATATNDKGDKKTEADSMLCIPSVELPLCTISYREGRWLAEPSDAEIHTVRSGDSVVVAGESWKLELPTIVEGTIAPDSDEINLRLVHAEFRHSRDQEHVVIYIHHGRQTIEIDARAHSYMLLLLAQARVRDRQQGDKSRSEEGWISVDALLDQLIDHDDNRLNVAIYRARKQLSEAGISNATELIERRPLAREVRIGFRNITVAAL